MSFKLFYFNYNMPQLSLCLFSVVVVVVSVVVVYALSPEIFHADHYSTLVTVCVFVVCATVYVCVTLL